MSLAAGLMGGSSLGLTTIMVCLIFGVNFFLFLVFQIVNYVDRAETEKERVDEKAKKLSKPFTGTLECFTNLTRELFITGAILTLTYVCENHWIFEHSQKSYSRDLFLFVLILFFAYAVYTIKPVKDLSLLGREQTEEWKGWMQFIFLLYHYFHAEEVYNSVRVMITCYVWMTGFGNFSFFYIKRDFGWLRLAQMLWRLNFSCLLLMWTHGNTWILYYICPMHTFYFLMVYITMYTYSSINITKWGIRFKLFALGVIIYIIWDINLGTFDALFFWLGNSSVVGAGSGSVWEYYFRTSLDHWSTFFGMIFALNYPLAEQYFHKAKGTPLILASVLMGAATLWWLLYCYTLDKYAYNLQHSYFAIIPLTAYIFFRNLTPAIRSGVSMSLHDLGKTTLETYLLQHHIWLTSNAKTLLTIVPGHPWINFALASMLFLTIAKELYRLTMSLRGMVMPDDQNIAWVNTLGLLGLLGVAYGVAWGLFLLAPSVLLVLMVCMLAAGGGLLALGQFGRVEGGTFKFWSRRLGLALLGVAALGTGVELLGREFRSAGSASQIGESVSGLGTSPVCLAAISKGLWQEVRCDNTAAGASGGLAYCVTSKWGWDSGEEGCPTPRRVATSQMREIYHHKKVLFVGDSEVRNVYHQWVALLEPEYAYKYAHLQLKHADIAYTPSFDPSIGLDFIWAPMAANVTSVIQSLLASQGTTNTSSFAPASAPTSLTPYSLIVSGTASWDALQTRSLDTYSKLLAILAGSIASSRGLGVSNTPSPSSSLSSPRIVWLQPTHVVTDRLADEKKVPMAEEIMAQYRDILLASPLAPLLDAVIDTQQASLGHSNQPPDGLHYSEEVYEVVAQMVANAYLAYLPQYNPVPKIPYVPKVTGSMSYPGYGLLVLALSAVMIFCCDSFLGIGFVSLFAFGRKHDWAEAYTDLHRKIEKSTEDAQDADAKDMDREREAKERNGREKEARGGDRDEEGDLESESLLELTQVE